MSSLHPVSLARPPHRLAALLLTLALAACGGGGGNSDTTDNANGSGGSTDSGQSAGGTGQTSDTGQTDSNTDGSGTTAGTDSNQNGNNNNSGMTRQAAYRLLTQGTFGPTDAALTSAMTMGPSAWVNDQLSKPLNAGVHLARWNADDAIVKAKNAKDTAGAPSVISSFYQQALQADDQLRQRVAYALSQIFVVSTADLGNTQAQAVASYYDMLTRDAFGNYRNLLQDVSMHPAMGLYLSSLKNRKEDPLTGRVPDQNFAREVMQLFSIGLVQLNTDGTAQRDGTGALIETYGSADIEGLSSVFTGFSWYGPDTSNARFNGTQQDPNRLVMPMQGYPQFHSMLAKSFLGTTVQAQNQPNPNASLKAAMDTLFNHPNVGPFISRQLIQRLVTSSPSPAYVARVAGVFNNNGNGVRGDLKAVARAILLDDEARSDTIAATSQFGKVREPVLRLTAFLRAFGAKSDSGKVLMGVTDDPGLSLGQTPLRSPGVFNFYRPGYVPPGGEAAALGMTLPEMQITNEASVAGYANFMVSAVINGAGLKGMDGKAARPDLQIDYSALLALAADPTGLVDQVDTRLFGSSTAVNATLRSELVQAVGSIVIPTQKADGSNRSLVEKAKANRVYAAVTLPLVAPEFIVQK